MQIDLRNKGGCKGNRPFTRRHLLVQKGKIKGKNTHYTLTRTFTKQTFHNQKEQQECKGLAVLDGVQGPNNPFKETWLMD